MMMNKRGCEMSHSIIPILCDELGIEILSRLGSPKYAVQCKLVSKPWRSLINTSQFMRRWRQINHKDENACLVLLTQHEDNNNYHHRFGQLANYTDSSLTESLEFKFPDNMNIYVVATHKDVMLCSPGLNNHTDFFLCNPFTKQWTSLPRPSPVTYRGEGYRIVVGLYVYDDIDNYTFKFKVLRIVLPSRDDDCKVEMFSSENSTAGWTPIDTSRLRYILPRNYHSSEPPRCYHRCVSYNGMLICLVTVEDPEPVIVKLIGFKIDPTHDADFVQLPLPLGYVPDSPCSWSMIGTCQERLLLSQFEDTAPLENQGFDPDLKLTTWRFDSQTQEWEFVYELDFNEMEDSAASSIVKSCLKGEYWRTTISVMAFHPYDEDIMYLFFGGSEDVGESQDIFYTFSCDVRKRTVEVIRGFPQTRCPVDVFPLLKPCWPTTIPLLPPP